MRELVVKTWVDKAGKTRKYSYVKRGYYALTPSERSWRGKVAAAKARREGINNIDAK